MVPSGRLLVVQHEDDCPLGWFGRWLAEGGIAVDVVRPYAGDPLPGLDGHAGLLVLGGSMGAYDDATYPWLGPVKALLREAVARRLPTLGICLGHQLLAVACGGRVDRNPDGKTIGLVKLSLADAARDDPMLGQVVDGATAVRWNQDIVVELPPKASLLATDDAGTPYAVRVGDRAWGVQFHPEAGPDLIRVWAADTATGPDGRPAPPDVVDAVAAAVAEIEDAEARLAGTWRSLALDFAGLVRAAASR
ncbi:type 1 glutamine amidotransferase [Actinopolymorpha pittospori]